MKTAPFGSPGFLISSLAQTIPRNVASCWSLAGEASRTRFTRIRFTAHTAAIDHWSNILWDGVRVIESFETEMSRSPTFLLDVLQDLFRSAPESSAHHLLCRNVDQQRGQPLSQHVRLLRRQGVDAQLLTLRDHHPGYYGDRPEIIVGTQDGRLKRRMFPSRQNRPM